MDIEKINNITDKLLEKLSEDYMLCETKSIERLKAEKDNDDALAKERLIKSLPNASETSKKLFADIHASTVDKVKKAKRNEIQKQAVQTEEFDFDLANEFDKDLDEGFEGIPPEVKETPPEVKGVTTVEDSEKNTPLKDKDGNVVGYSEAKSKSIFERIRERHEKRLAKKASRIQSKITRLKLHRSQLETKITKCKKQHIIDSINKRIENIDAKISKLLEKNSKIDAKISKHEINESLDIDIDLLYEDVERDIDEISNELKAIEEELDSAEQTKELEYDEIFSDDTGRTLKSLLINFDSIDEPYTKKIVSLIRRELMKPDIDKARVTELKLKLKNTLKEDK